MIPGTYKMRCVRAVLCQKDSGTEYIGAVLEVVEGECAGDQITAYLFWTEKTEERTRRDLDCIGWDKGVKTVVDDAGEEEVQLTGMKNLFQAGVTEEEYQGKKRLKINWIGSPPAGIAKKDRLTMAQAKGLLSRLKGTPNGQAPAPAATGGYVQRGGADEDIPF